MPEGDNIFVAARTLNRALAGREILTYASDIAPADLVGRTITRVEPRGKNVLMHLDDGRVLHSHMMMSGSWHIYRPGEKWQRPETQARIVITTERFVAVGFNVPVASVMTERVAEREVVANLGPDMLAAEWDRAQILARLRARGDLSIGVALMYQRLVAGIGNVYKSEILFICRVDPWSLIDALDDDTLGRILDTARALMLANLEGKRRRTREGPERVHVYGRSGKACFTCGTRVLMRRQGDQGRSTYYCATCQGVR